MRRLITFTISMFIVISSTGGGFKSDQIAESKANVEQYKHQVMAERIDSLENSTLTISGLVDYLQLSTEVNLVAHLDNREYELDTVPTENIEIILRQIILESGWLRSGLTKRHNNLLGMKYARSRLTLASGTAMGHASFNHWTDSVKDYILWKQYWEDKGYDTSDYYAFLDHVGYATAQRYIPTLKSINLNREVTRIQSWQT